MFQAKHFYIIRIQIINSSLQDQCIPTGTAICLHEKPSGLRISIELQIIAEQCQKIWLFPEDNRG